MTGKQIQTTVVAGLLIVGGTALLFFGQDKTIAASMITAGVGGVALHQQLGREPRPLPEIDVTVEQAIDEDVEDDDDATK